LDPRPSHQIVRFFPFRPVAKALLPVVEPLKYVIYVMPLLALTAVMLLIHYSELVAADLETLRSTTTLITHALFSLLTINLAVQTTQALIAQKFRASVGWFGIGLRFGF